MIHRQVPHFSHKFFRGEGGIVLEGAEAHGGYWTGDIIGRQEGRTDVQVDRGQEGLGEIIERHYGEYFVRSEDGRWSSQERVRSCGTEVRTFSVPLN